MLWHYIVELLDEIREEKKLILPDALRRLRNSILIEFPSSHGRAGLISNVNLIQRLDFCLISAIVKTQSWYNEKLNPASAYRRRNPFT